MMQWSPSINASAGWTTFQILKEILDYGQMTTPKIKDQRDYKPHHTPHCDNKSTLTDKHDALESILKCQHRLDYISDPQ